MITRLTWAAVLSIALIPPLTLGFLDPLEGLPALVLGLGLGVAVRLMSRMRIPKISWIPVVVVAGLWVVTLAMAALSPRESGDAASNPVTGMPIQVIAMWLARFADVVMVAGLVYYAVLVCRALRLARRARHRVRVGEASWR
jgi:hypothetical protein